MKEFLRKNQVTVGIFSIFLTFLIMGLSIIFEKRWILSYILVPFVQLGYVYGYFRGDTIVTKKQKWIFTGIFILFFPAFLFLAALSLGFYFQGTERITLFRGIEGIKNFYWFCLFVLYPIIIVFLIFPIYLLKNIDKFFSKGRGHVNKKDFSKRAHFIFQRISQDLVKKVSERDIENIISSKEFSEGEYNFFKSKNLLSEEDIKQIYVLEKQAQEEMKNSFQITF